MSADDDKDLPTVPFIQGRKILEDLGVTMPTVKPIKPQNLARPKDVPATFGRLATLRELGRGAMGKVVSARDDELGRTVAVKVVIDSGATPKVQLDAFLLEARITALLEHPGVLPVYDMGTTDEGAPYLVMRKVDGRSLQDVLLKADDRWTPHRAVSVFLKVCETLAYAHDRGVIHRDIKPANVMLGNFGEVLLLDWGAATFLGAPEIELPEVPDEERAFGSPAYMSPEQARGEDMDARSDVFSLGSLLFEMLTLRPAFHGDSVIAVMFALVNQSRPDPRTANPGRAVPEGLAVIVERALQLEPEARYPTVEALAQDVSAWVDGSAARHRAEAAVEEAREHRLRFDALVEDTAALRASIEQLETSIPPWRPLTEKTQLVACRQRLARLVAERALAFGDILGACERALAHDPEHPAARDVLADAWLHRFLEAEQAGDTESALWFQNRVSAYGGPRHQALLAGDGTLTLRTDPPGAEVYAERFDTEPLVWRPGEGRSLGTTPLEGVSLPMGSYRLTLRAVGRRDTVYPVHITRGRAWVTDEPVRLLTERECGGPAWRYVPAGPYVAGGDREAVASPPRHTRTLPGFLITADQVTMEEYAAFLTALHLEDPDAAWARSPRQSQGLGKTAGYWERPGPDGRYVVPEKDRDGDPWNPSWPAAFITWDDAQAYAAWVSDFSGVPTRLPGEDEWEKAPRGVDGRFFPWGNGFDPTLCHVATSREGRPFPDVVGSTPTDESVYGVRDLAGGCMDLCQAESFDGDPVRRPVRGGSWRSQPRSARLAGRGALEHFLVGANLGFRLVRGLPER